MMVKRKDADVFDNQAQGRSSPATEFGKRFCLERGGGRKRIDISGSNWENRTIHARGQEGGRKKNHGLLKNGGYGTRATGSRKSISIEQSTGNMSDVRPTGREK